MSAPTTGLPLIRLLATIKKYQEEKTRKFTTLRVNQPCLALMPYDLENNIVRIPALKYTPKWSLLITLLNDILGHIIRNYI
jgi:hypothetical protein